jgi:hypothetical protein
MSSVAPARGAESVSVGLTPPFEDLDNFNAAGYWETNEEPEVHRELLSGIRLHRAAAIASGGEVSYFVLLPKVQKELVLVDHSYHSLAVCFLKACLLQQRGADQTKALFVSGDREAIVDALLTVKDGVPEKLRSHICSYGGELTPHRFYSENNLRREWLYAPLDAIRASARKLSKLRLLHGDLSTLKGRGPFDLLYISNALDHTGVGGKRLGKEDIEPSLKKGGYVLLTKQAVNYNTSGTNPSNMGWKLIREIRGFRTSWIHSLYQVGE